MQNGKTNRIEVTTFYKLNDCIMYNIILHEDTQQYYCSFRYSQLYQFYQKLHPLKVNIPFPSKNYLPYFKFFKSEKDEFIKQRLCNLKKFFQAVSSSYGFDESVIRDFVDRGKRQHYESLKSPKLRPMKMADVNNGKMSEQFIVV